MAVFRVGAPCSLPVFQRSALPSSSGEIFDIISWAFLIILITDINACDSDICDFSNT